MPYNISRRYDDSFVKTLIRLWPLVIALISIVVMATTLKVKVDDHETRIGRIEASMDAIKGNTDRLVSELLEKRRDLRFRDSDGQ